MDRQQLLKRLDSAWQAFHDSYAGMSEAELTQPGVVDDWSVKDLIAHVAWWEQEALTHLPHIVAGERPPRYSERYGGIDAFNALMAERMRAHSLDKVRWQAEDMHARLVAYVERVPEELIVTETRFRRRLRLDTYGHYPLHTEMIREWRATRPRGKS